MGLDPGVTAFERAVDDALDRWWELHPVDASFAGETRYDDRFAFPADLIAHERAVLRTALAALDAVTIPDDPYARVDVRTLRATFTQAIREWEERPRFHNPAWYTGEVAFGVIAHLLPDAVPRSPRALAARIAAMPAFLDAGIGQLRERPAPAAWVDRARAETFAVETLLREGIALHPRAATFGALEITPALAAVRRFRDVLATMPDADARCGAAFLDAIVGSVHGLPDTSASLERRATDAFAAALDDLVATAARIDPATPWRDQLAALGTRGPATAAEALASYRHWNDRALRDAAALVTPAEEYQLSYEPLPAWAAPVHAALYFLFYRAPAARFPGDGSIYWVGALDDVSAARAHNTWAVKTTHAVHHGSIGHHTQNARARASRSRVGRVAGTDGAMGLAMLAAGTMAEGWASYVGSLLVDAPGFYAPEEAVGLAYDRVRAIGWCLADVRYHRGIYTLEEMRRFYRDEVGFAEARIVPETTRNAMFPGSRVMYWTGTEQIAALRARSGMPAKQFHDTLLSFGATPIAHIADEEHLWCSPAHP